ncbi:pirin family protein [Cellulomonas soli]|uniref:pirin family protein n=1 Tax=Cellulomonas soli TaxID=931535 RepID=UPI003F830DFA
MSTMEESPGEVVCRTGEAVAGVELLVPRDVPLGGPRAMAVRRTLPQRERSLIGAWCFLDHYGPDDVTGRGMQVPRHPHTGLATVSWLFSGEIEHRDSTGAHAMVRPGEVNLMTAGRGISHSEFSTPGTRLLHGVQLWLALPDASRHVAPSFEHHRPDPVEGDGFRLAVFLGSLAGAVSPVRTQSAVVAAQVDLAPGARWDLALDPRFEHGVLLDSGELTLAGGAVPVDHLAYLPTGLDEVRLEAGAQGVRALLIGGEPLGEQIVMWWNFVGRSHEEVVAYRAAWQAEIGVESAPTGAPDGPPRFGPFAAGTPAPLPAPVLPALRMRPRG